MIRKNIPFSPPDMTEAEAKEVREAILSGWITTGPRTKRLEAQISEYAALLKKMNYPNIKAYLFYVEDKKIEEVEL